MINRHSVLLFIVLVAIGFGLFTMVGFQKKNAFAPVSATSGGGLVINVNPGGIVAPSTGTTAGSESAPAAEAAPAAADGACP